MDTTIPLNNGLHELACGVLVSRIERPATAIDVAALLTTATADNASVTPFGGRRSIATGNAVSTAPIGLDTTGITGIISYEPADLTVSVRSGTSFAEVQSELAKHGQELAIDVPNPALSTVGGVVATGFAGPRKLRAGSLRDLLIGCEYVRGDGMLAKAGGMVVKNVSGYEIPRFLHGSWGSLAVLTSVNLKVAPIGRADGTVVSSFDTLVEAVDAASNLIAAEPLLEACTVTDFDGVCRVSARFVGRANAVEQTLGTIQNRLGAGSTVLETDESRAYWQAQVDQFAESTERVVVAFGTRARDVAALAAAMNETFSDLPGRRVMVSPGTGVLRVSYPVRSATASESLMALTGIAKAQGATWVVESAPVAQRSQVTQWGPEPDGIAVMRAVKAQFDPTGILNTGRLFI